MGHRANYVILEGDRREIYYSHWGATAIPQDVFMGPRACLDYFRSFTPQDDLLDDCWCEGAALIDLNEHRLCFYGGEDILNCQAYQRMEVEVLKPLWNNWRVEWAGQGLFDIIAALGLDPTPYRLRKHNVRPLVPEPELWAETLVTGENQTYCVNIFLSDLLSQGPALLARLARWPHRQVPAETDLSGGLHIDPANRRLHWWSGRAQENLALERLIWPGWTLSRHQGGLPQQLTQAGTTSSSLLEEEAILDHILGCLNHRSTFQPAEVLQNLEAAGKSVTDVHPHFLDHRPARRGEWCREGRHFFLT